MPTKKQLEIELAAEIMKKEQAQASVREAYALLDESTLLKENKSLAREVTKLNNENVHNENLKGKQFSIVADMINVAQRGLSIEDPFIIEVALSAAMRVADDNM